jgi:cation transport ATPase
MGLHRIAILRFAASLELRSEHPIGAALRRARTGAGRFALGEVDGFQSLPGFGAQAR